MPPRLLTDEAKLIIFSCYDVYYHFFFFFAVKSGYNSDFYI